MDYEKLAEILVGTSYCPDDIAMESCFPSCAKYGADTEACKRCWTEAVNKFKKCHIDVDGIKTLRRNEE